MEIDGLAFVADDGGGKYVNCAHSVEAEDRRTERAGIVKDSRVRRGKIPQIERYDVLRSDGHWGEGEFLSHSSSEDGRDGQFPRVQIVAHFQVGVPAWLQSPVCGGDRLSARFPIRRAEQFWPRRVRRRRTLSANLNRQRKQKGYGKDKARTEAGHGGHP